MSLIQRERMDGGGEEGGSGGVPDVGTRLSKKP